MFNIEGNRGKPDITREDAEVIRRALIEKSNKEKKDTHGSK